jgi:hypothetical protein
VPESVTVLIAAPDLIPALSEQMSEARTELLIFSDADALRALEVIASRRPHIVALERLFAATPRGAALINRIKADPALAQSEIRVISRDAEHVRVSPRIAADGPHAPSAAATHPAATGAPLDQRGTRRAPRFKIKGQTEVSLDGNAATLVDLSIVGAQVVSTTILKPNQKLRVTLSDEQGSVRFNAVVAWAAFEIPPKSGPRYRAGIEFVDAVAATVEAYCLRHKA